MHASLYNYLQGTAMWHVKEVYLEFREILNNSYKQRFYREF